MQDLAHPMITQLLSAMPKWGILVLFIAPLYAQLPEKATVACIVADHKGGLADAELSLSGELGTFHTRTDWRGAAVVACPAGSYTLTVSKAGYQPANRSISVLAGRVFSLLLPLESTADSRLDPTQSTATRNSEHVSEAPATSFVITDQQIRERGYISLQDVIQDIPEITVLKYVNPDVQDMTSSRGIVGSEKFLLLQDGVQISSASGDPNTISYNYPVTSAKQIEVILGPASALYGADAYAGVINIISDKGGLAPLSVHGNAAAGRFNTMQYGLTLNGMYKNVKIFANSSYYQSDETPFWKFYPKEFSKYQNGIAKDTFLLYPGIPTVLPAGIDRTYATPAMAYSIHSGLQWRGWEAGFSQRKMEHCSSIGDHPAWSVYGAQATLDNINQSLYLKHLLKTSNPRWSLNTMLWHNSNHLSDKDATSYVNAATNYTVGYRYTSSHVTRLTEQFNYNLSSALTGSVGVQAEYVQSVPLSAYLPHPYNEALSPFEQNMVYPGTNIQIPFFHIKYINTAAYGQVRYAAPRYGLDLLLGARYDFSTAFGGKFSPRLGAVWHPVQNNRKLLTLKLMYGEGYLAPSPWKTYAHHGTLTTNTQGQAVASFYHMPNPDLKPEKLHSLEASVSLRPTEAIVVTANTYVNIITKNILINGIFQSGGDTSLIMSEFSGITFAGQIETPINTGASEAYGAAIRGNGILNINKNTNVEFILGYTFTGGAYTYIDSLSLGRIWQNRQGNLDSGVFLLGNTPRHVLKGGAVLQHKKWVVSARFQWVGEMTGEVNAFGYADYDDYGENFLDQKYFSPKYFIVNSNILYKVISNKKIDITLSAKATNLLDKRYYNAYHGGDRGLSRVPQDPFRWYGGLYFTFK